MIQEEIFSSIEAFIKEKFNSMNISRDVASVVTSVSNGKYKVLIDGSTYLVKDGVGVKPSVGTAVWVRIPNDSYREAYICALR
jgi:UDP-N-acetyl-D-mannosaminuronic acid transferase (WecB/TagA/CpsF family)